MNSIIAAIVFSCISFCITLSDSANILGLFTSHSPSHLIVHMSVMKVLAERGHNVTVVVTQMPAVTHKDIHMIIIPPTEEQVQRLELEVSKFATTKNNMLTALKIFGSFSFVIDMQADVLRDKRFTALYDEKREKKFDLLICSLFLSTFQLGVAAKLKVPVIQSWTAPPMILIDSLVGNPWASAYVPNMNMAIRTGVKMTFMQRIENLVINYFMNAMMQLIDIRMKSIYNELFHLDDDNETSFPTFDDMYKNISLVFCNSHFSEGPVRPNVPAIVEIGGIQVKQKADPLPKDINDFLAEAKDHGAILFSLGSNLKGSKIHPQTAINIFNVLSKLKQKIIWKWEELQSTPGNASNILYKQWMPQDDILAHPNLKLFITHAGKGGMAEAQYHGVPMLAIPIFADQHVNAEKVVTAGYGQQLDLHSITEESFKAHILDILHNFTYKENVEKFSQLYRDRPLSPEESVAFWSEYVIRHHGAAHMQSPLVHMNFIESLNIDVFAMFFVIVYILYRILKIILKFIWRKWSKRCLKARTIKED